jgi:hypothetical protein
MNDDRFFERLRDDAQQLRYEPDELMLTRLSARVRARLTAPPTVESFLARWFRPLAASLAALALAATLGVQWYESRQQQQATTIEAAMSADPIEISVDGNTYTLSR